MFFTVFLKFSKVTTAGPHLIHIVRETFYNFRSQHLITFLSIDPCIFFFYELTLRIHGRQLLNGAFRGFFDIIFFVLRFNRCWFSVSCLRFRKRHENADLQGYLNIYTHNNITGELFYNFIIEAI